MTTASTVTVLTSCRDFCKRDRSRSHRVEARLLRQRPHWAIPTRAGLPSLERTIRRGPALQQRACPNLLTGKSEKECLPSSKPSRHCAMCQHVYVRREKIYLRTSFVRNSMHKSNTAYPTRQLIGIVQVKVNGSITRI
jgi:hypothetical protein